MRLLGIFLTLAAALFLAAACGGDDNGKSSATPASSGSSSTGQALKDYFQQLSASLTKVQDQMNQLNNKYPSAGTDPDQTRQFLAELLPTITEALSDIKNLDVPSEEKDRHDEFVSAHEDVLTAFQGLSNDVQDINSASDVKDYFANHKSDFSAKTDRADAACSALQSVADSSHLSVDLNCTGMSNSGPSPVSGSATH